MTTTPTAPSQTTPGPRIGSHAAIDRPRPRRRRRVLSPLWALRSLILFGFAVFCLVPLIWLVLEPTKSATQTVNQAPLSFGSFDRIAQAWRHLAAYNNGVIYQWMLNSVYYTAVSLIITVGASLLAGYALGTMTFAGRKIILIATLLAMVLPATAVVLPLFLEINSVHLTNTALSVMLPASFFPFGVYLAFIYYSTSLPTELLEAARIDGCSELRVFMHVALPLARPLVALLSFFSFVSNWNNFFLPYVMLSDETKYNLPVGLATLITGSQALSPSGRQTALPISYPEAALAGLIVVVPVALLFIGFQRFLVRGILLGASKG